MTSPLLSRRTVATYAAGSIGTGGFATLPGLVLVYYLTDTLGVAALMAGILLAVAKIWDVVIDPVIGLASDRLLARTGTRRRMMILGSLTLPLFFALTFAVPGTVSPVAAGIWVMVAFVLCATAFSLFQVPYIALPAEIAHDYDDRTRLLTWRVIVLTLAILAFGAGGPMLRSLGGGGRAGYLIMGLVAGVAIGVGLLIAARTAPRGLPGEIGALPGGSGAPLPPADTNLETNAVLETGTVPETSTDPETNTGPTSVRVLLGEIGVTYGAGIRALQRSAPFRALLSTFVLQGLATGLMLAGAQYVATWVLGSEDAVTLLFVSLIAPAVLFTPVWAAISKRIGKERAYAISSMLFGVAALALLGLIWAPGVWVYAPVALVGAGYAGMQALPMAMLPDVISYDARTSGDGNAGVFGGVWTAGETAGMALGATVLTAVLAVTGYVESTGGVVTQPDLAINGIVIAFSIIPAALMAVSLFTLSRYRLRREDIDEVLSPGTPIQTSPTGEEPA